MLIVETRARQFEDQLNRSHFAFTHNLSGHPLFELPRLAVLCGKVPARQTRVYESDAGSPMGRPKVFAGEWKPADLIASLAGGTTRVSLANVEACDDEYRDLHRQIMNEIDQLSGFALGREVDWSSMTMLLSSPGVTTPYHVDHQTNLLLQMRGSKNVFVFDFQDRRVLSEVMLEQYYGGDKHAPAYREESQDRAADYELIPGAALHNPPLSPHWVRNGADISVSVSINFSLRESEAKARIYQVNRYLRRMGLKPTPPGRSRLRDWIKSEPFRLLTRRPRNLQDLMDSGPSRLLRPMASLLRLWRSAP